MTGALTIRPIQPGDRPAWGDLWRAYLAFYETALPETIYDTTFARLLSPDHPDQNGLIALLDDRPAGLVHYIYHAHNWRVEQVGYLQDLYAAPEARGCGVGRALIEAVYAHADADGCPAVYWLTQEFNATARQLYDRIGKLTPFVKYTR
ncbi:Acetyltransferase (GNAT) family protein [Roseovarius azorensis]|uniref:Acetyltransferase (GNAT) family protein n=1 Tax=Roseovarius azorensis TaxID=1287727 RepID=A0A1H7JR34_9RHOB|nr:GNAT family N-acetyltransferase [Roseovarius azorensis]SEK76307.1 Acetyltransferase (GNAT) family protein [Roseovarius azorensis]